jgi:thiol-disulfide isomerase/thioredoxin
MSVVESLRSFLSDRKYRMLLIAVLVGGVALALFLMYRKNVRSQVELFKVAEQSGSDMTASSSPSGSSDFVMYYADWCGYCQKAKPEFQKLMEDSDLSKMGVNPRMVDAEQNEAAAKADGVQGFPTFILKKNGKNIPYEGGYTYSEFIKFLKDNN